MSRNLRGWSDIDSARDPVDPEAELRRTKYDFEEDEQKGSTALSPWSINDWRRDVANISVVSAPRSQPKEKVFGAFEVEKDTPKPAIMPEHSVYHGLALMMLVLSGVLMCAIAVLLML